MNGLLDGVPLVNHHCHGIVRDVLDRPQFEALLTEAEGPGPVHPSLFDTQAGFGVRAICAPLLDLPHFATPDAYLARRAELGVDEVTRRMLAAAGITDYLVDTGFLPDRVTTPGELAAYTHASGHEVLRLEAIAEQLIATTDAASFADSVPESGLLERHVQRAGAGADAGVGEVEVRAVREGRCGHRDGQRIGRLLWLQCVALPAPQV